jgi:hypothetical protein
VGRGVACGVRGAEDEGQGWGGVGWGARKSSSTHRSQGQRCRQWPPPHFPPWDDPRERGPPWWTPAGPWGACTPGCRTPPPGSQTAAGTPPRCTWGCRGGVGWGGGCEVGLKGGGIGIKRCSDVVAATHTARPPPHSPQSSAQPQPAHVVRCSNVWGWGWGEWKMWVTHPRPNRRRTTHGPDSTGSELKNHTPPMTSHVKSAV